MNTWVKISIGVAVAGLIIFVGYKAMAAKGGDTTMQPLGGGEGSQPVDKSKWYTQNGITYTEQGIPVVTKERR